MSNFRAKVLHAREHKFKITGSLGVLDAYHWERDNGFPTIGHRVTHGAYSKIIRNIDKVLAEALSNGEEVLLPEYMGKLHLKKVQPRTSVKDGKLKTTLPIDWGSTLKLWEEDEEAHKNKQLVRHEVRDVFRIHHSVYDRVFPNAWYFKFYPGHYLRQRLVEKAKNNEVDAYNIF